MKLINSLSPGSWSYIGGVTVAVAACVALLIREKRLDKKFQREYDEQRDRFI